MRINGIVIHLSSVAIVVLLLCLLSSSFVLAGDKWGEECKWRSKSVPSGGRKVYHLGTKLAL